MTNLAQQMAATAESAQDVAREQARIESEKKRQQQQEWIQQGKDNADAEFPKILEEIKARSQKGFRTHDISIQSMSSHSGLSYHESGYDQRMKELLTENGFRYTTYSYADEPVGSDPFCWHTLYGYGLNVSW